VDEKAEELFLSVQDPAYVVVYNKYAKENDSPLRILRGNKTLLADAHGIGLDTKNGWLFVANYGHAALYRDDATEEEIADWLGGRLLGSGSFEPPSITVYPIKAEGDVAPIRRISGSRTNLNWPSHIFVDEEHGDLYVANDADHSVLVFKVTDDGNVAPARVIEGPDTMLMNPTGIFVDLENEEIVVSNMGNHRATVYPRTANGNVAPKRMIRGGPEGQPALQIGNPGAVAYDTKRDEILVPN
jgi:6-phosphogluconolactonase (cycloisomerase 2 family)